MKRQKDKQFPIAAHLVAKAIVLLQVLHTIFGFTTKNWSLLTSTHIHSILIKFIMLSHGEHGDSREEGPYLLN